MTNVVDATVGAVCNAVGNVEVDVAVAAVLDADLTNVVGAAVAAVVVVVAASAATFVVVAASVEVIMAFVGCCCCCCSVCFGVSCT